MLRLRFRTSARPSTWGLSLDEVANGDTILARASEHDPAIKAVYVIDLEGQLLHVGGAPPEAIDRQTLESFDEALRGITGPDWATESDTSIRSGSLIHGSFSQPLGAVVVEYRKTEMRRQVNTMMGRLALNGLIVAIGLMLLGGLAVGVLEARYIAVSTSVLLVAGVAVLGAMTVREFNSALEPELERRAALIGETIRGDTERAVGVGIPIDELVGVGEYFAVFLDEFPELDYLAIQDDEGQVLYSDGAPNGEEEIVLGGGGSSQSSFSVQSESRDVGLVVVGVDSGFIRSRLRDLGLDVVVILVVSLVIASEVMRVLSRRIEAPSDPRVVTPEGQGARDRGAGDIRMVLFLFVVGEELNKSFLPILIKAADNPVSSLNPSIAISLPIVAYLFTIAVSSPVAGKLIERFGSRGLFIMGAVPAALSHLGMVFADNLVQIILLRSLTGVGFAVVTIAAMDYILDKHPDNERSKGIGAFVAVIIGGSFVGTALGGIIADRLGYDVVFMISLGLVALAGVLGLVVIQQGEDDRVAQDSFSLRAGSCRREAALPVVAAGRCHHPNECSGSCVPLVSCSTDHG